MAESTKNTILRVAERLYASQGFAATSLRAIIKEAGVNTAAIHYHFGSREALIAAVIERRARDVNRRRLELLSELEAAHAQGPLPLEGVIEAFLRPVIRMHIEDPEDARVFRRLAGRVAMETGEDLREVVMDVFENIRERFVPALQRALPGATREDVLWNLHFMVGAMCFAITIPPPERRPDGKAGEDIERDVLARLVSFATGGMRAANTVA